MKCDFLVWKCRKSVESSRNVCSVSRVGSYQQSLLFLNILKYLKFYTRNFVVKMCPKHLLVCKAIMIADS